MKTLTELGREKSRVRKGAVREKITGEDIRRLLADVATGGGVPFIDAASQAAQGNYGQAAVSGLLDAAGPIGKGVAMVAAPVAAMAIPSVRRKTAETLENYLMNSGLAPQAVPFKLSKELENAGVSNDVIPIFLKYKKAEMKLGSDPYLAIRGDKIAKTRALNDLLRALGGVDDADAVKKFSKLNTLYDMKGEQSLYSNLD